MRAPRFVCPPFVEPEFLGFGLSARRISDQLVTECLRHFVDAGQMKASISKLTRVVLLCEVLIPHHDRIGSGHEVSTEIHDEPVGNGLAQRVTQLDVAFAFGSRLGTGSGK